MIKKAGVATALIAGTGLFALTADAAWRTTYSGLECMPEGLASAQYVGGNIYSNSISTTNLVFVCPLARNESDLSGAVLGVEVSVLDNHTGDEITCFARSCTDEGGGCDNSLVFGSGIADTGNETLVLGNVPSEIEGYAYVSCSVPEKQNNVMSGIKSFKATD
jgi:hypothetical protein